MDWRDQLELELGRAREALRQENAGRARASARRAVWVVVNEYQRRTRQDIYGRDAMRQLAGIADNDALPEAVRSAADRLRARLSPDFSSPSLNPLADATLIIGHFEPLIGP